MVKSNVGKGLRKYTYLGIISLKMLTYFDVYNILNVGEVREFVLNDMSKYVSSI